MMVQNTNKGLRISRKGKPRRQMSRAADIAEGKELIQKVFSVSLHGSVQQACYTAYRTLRLATVRRAETIWQGSIKRIDPWELDALRHEKAKQDANATILHLERTAAFLANVDPEFYGPTVDQLRHVASGIGARREDTNEQQDQ